jgi:DNA-3-methyladenine glycosylase I
MRNEGIIRNAKKIDAAVENAKRILALGQPFASWLAAHHPRSKEEWVTGGEITGSFLISIGYLPGAHDENCAVYRRISRLKPKWATSPGPATR